MKKRPKKPTTPVVAPQATWIEEAHRNAILAALNATKGNKLQAARLLDVEERTLYRMIKRYGIPLATGSGMNTRLELVVKMAVRTGGPSQSCMVLLSGPALLADYESKVGTRFVDVAGEAFKIESIATEEMGAFPGDLWVWARNVGATPKAIPAPGSCRTHLTSKE